MPKLKKVEVPFEYEEVLDARTRGLVRVAASIAVGCPTWLRNAFAVAKGGGAAPAEQKEAMAWATIVSAGRARNFALSFKDELGFE